ncbi:MAG: hypothetical protein AB8E87_05575 [Prochlorococcus sp.]
MPMPIDLLLSEFIGEFIVISAIALVGSLRGLNNGINGPIRSEAG